MFDYVDYVIFVVVAEIAETIIALCPTQGIRRYARTKFITTFESFKRNSLKSDRSTTGSGVPCRISSVRGGVDLRRVCQKMRWKSQATHTGKSMATGNGARPSGFNHLNRPMTCRIPQDCVCAFLDEFIQVDRIQFDKILGCIEEGKKSGAKLMCGGKRWGDKGYYIEPTVFADVDQNSTIAREEVWWHIQTSKFWSAAESSWVRWVCLHHCCVG